MTRDNTTCLMCGETDASPTDQANLYAYSCCKAQDSVAVTGPSRPIRGIVNHLTFLRCQTSWARKGRLLQERLGICIRSTQRYKGLE